MTLTIKREKKKRTIQDRLQLATAFKRTLRAAPSFFVLSLIGTAAVYGLRVPASQRTIAAAVPLVVVFLMSRAMALLIPPLPPGADLKPVPKGFIVFFLVVFGSAFLALDLLFSSAIFALLSLPGLMDGAMELALKFGMVSSLGVVLGIFYALQKIGRELGMNLTDLITIALWKLFLCPRVFANRLFLAH